MLRRSSSTRTAARLSAATRLPVRTLIEPLEIRRLLSGAGQLDPNFGGGSGFVTDASSGVPLAVVTQKETNKIVVLLPGDVVERFNVNGTLDTTFGSGGRLTLSLPGGTSSSGRADMALGDNDELYVAVGGTVAAITSYGALDVNFGAGAGYVVSPKQAESIAYDAVHHVIDVAGTTWNTALDPHSNTGWVEQFSNGGALNWSTQVPGESWSFDIAVRDNGKIDVVGSSGIQAIQAVGTFMQYNSDGTPDQSFQLSQTGSLPTAAQRNNASGYIDHITALPDGTFALSGEAGYGPSTYYFDVYNDDGSVAYAAQLSAPATGLALLSNHQLDVSTTRSGGAGFVERFNTNGTIDASFGNGGSAPAPVTSSPFAIGALTHSPDNKLIVATSNGRGPGYQEPSNLTLVRYTADNAERAYPPGGGTPNLSGVHEAENYDAGGEGVAYHDTDATNNGGQYRSDGVDVESIGNTGGYAVDYTHTGESISYTMNNATAGVYGLDVQVANFGSGATFHLEDNGARLTGEITIPDTGSFTHYADLNAGSYAIGAGTHVIKIVFDSNSQYGFAGNVDSFGFQLAQNTPYNGSPFYPGQQVEAENFNTGGEGVAYHDTDASNNGGQYRPTEGVDLDAANDANAGYYVGWTHTGEYLSYAGNFVTSTNYDLAARVANYGAGGSFHVLVDGTNVTGQINVPDTGGFQNWQTISRLNIPIAAGAHTVRIVFDGQSQYGFSGNLNWFRLQPSALGSEGPYGGTAANLPGIVQGEAYDTGGEGVAYYDTDASNTGGGLYRNDGVDLESIGGTSNYAVDYAHAGEWLKYMVNVTLPGTYTFDARVANYGSGGAFHVEVDGVNVTGTLAVTDTGSFTNYTDVLKSGITLTGGQHSVRFVWDGNSQYGFSGNLDSFKFS